RNLLLLEKSLNKRDHLLLPRRMSLPCWKGNSVEAKKTGNTFLSHLTHQAYFSSLTPKATKHQTS
ncbi:Hypothetical predicted protein, partial [Prunus dulcis]